MTDSRQPCTASMSSVLTTSIPAVAPEHLRPEDLTQTGDGGRRKVRASGVVAEVAIAPVQECAQFSAVLISRDPDDHAAQPLAVRLVWQGQRSVPGVGVGVALDCVGLLCQRAGEPTIFNPRYEIVAKKVQR